MRFRFRDNAIPYIIDFNNLCLAIFSRSRTFWELPEPKKRAAASKRG
jgi:hypothetical protein